MVNDLAAILSGIPRGEIQILDGQSSLYLGFDAFESTGFGNLMDDSNQVRHFTAGFNLGYKYPMSSHLVNVVRPEPSNPADALLNTASSRIGRGIRYGTISLDNIGNEIRALGR